ncbi:hypothetical protein [Streptomyces sp. NPDC005799]|uniref:hypothetical protein n=1 Tax=Streptomyces sp. NPDC005799 TaxID=3154678 RepID=UPI00340E0C23
MRHTHRRARPPPRIGARPAGRLAADALADRVMATAHDAGLRDFVIAGTPLDAILAVKVAARHADLVRSLFALSGLAQPRTALWLNLEMWASLHARRNTFLTSLPFSGDHLR